MPKSVHINWFPIHARSANSIGNVTTETKTWRKTLPCSVCEDGVEGTSNHYANTNVILRDNRKCSVIKSASTVVDQGYYNTHSAYMRAKFNTFEQKHKNLDYNVVEANLSGGCQVTVWPTIRKLNNTAYNVQGAVDSSQRIANVKQQTVISGKALADKMKQAPCVSYRRVGR